MTPTHKVVAISNFGLETFAEYTVANCVNKEVSQKVCDALNIDGENSDVYYTVKPMYYALWRGMEELV